MAKKSYLKPGKVVILLTGRFAGRKAVVVKVNYDGSKNRQFGHVLVAGIDHYPGRVSKSASKARIEKASKIKPFIKYVNMQHIIATRYNVDIDVRQAVEAPEASGDNAEARLAAKGEVKKVFEDRYLNGNGKVTTGTQFFFQKLRF